MNPEPACEAAAPARRGFHSLGRINYIIATEIPYVPTPLLFDQPRHDGLCDGLVRKSAMLLLPAFPPSRGEPHRTGAPASRDSLFTPALALNFLCNLIAPAELLLEAP